MECVPASWARLIILIFAVAVCVHAQGGSPRSPVVVSTVLEKPWASEDSNGNLEGFIPDVFKEISKVTNLSFTLRESKDGYYGRLVNGSWTGIIGEIQRQEAELGAPLSRTPERSKVLDSTDVIDDRERATIITLRHQTEVVEDASLFFFLKPFTFGVWLFMAVAFLVVGCMILIYRHFWPYSRDRSVEPKDTDTFAEDVREAYWFTFVALMIQGFDRRPRPLAARVLSAFWFMFVLVTLLLYLAGLVNHLSISWPITKSSKAITSTEELAAQTEIKYGIVRGGNLNKFFDVSKNKLYVEMKKYMDSEDTYVENYSEGMTKVMEGKFAFIMVGASADYYLSMNCLMAKVGTVDRWLTQTIGGLKGSATLSLVRDAVNRLRAKEILKELYEKWFKDSSCKAEDVTAPPEQRRPTKVTLRMYAGPLVVLLIGILLSLAVFLVQFFYYRCCQQGSYSPKEKGDVEGGGSANKDKDAPKEPDVNHVDETEMEDKGEKKDEDKNDDKEGKEDKDEKKGKEEPKEEDRKEDDKDSKDKEAPAEPAKESDKGGK